MMMLWLSCSSVRVRVRFIHLTVRGRCAIRTGQTILGSHCECACLNLIRVQEKISRHENRASQKTPSGQHLPLGSCRMCVCSTAGVVSWSRSRHSDERIG